MIKQLYMQKLGLLFIVCVFNALFFDVARAYTPEKKDLSVIERELHDRSRIRIQFLTENILRIQIAPENQSFESSGLNRYGQRAVLQ